ncbi:hypothetical protein [Nocardia nepalensis]|uniref:hypothetical protein n=1 Tax=Nocardia nepalensis TaxID=3375448 RepID=UPI003B67A667
MDKYTNSLPVRVIATTPAHPLTSQNAASAGIGALAADRSSEVFRDTHWSTPPRIWAETSQLTSEPRDRGAVAGLRNGTS